MVYVVIGLYVYIALYHIISVLLLPLVGYTNIFFRSIIKDVAWFLIPIFLVFMQKRYIPMFISKTKYVLASITIVTILVILVSHRYHNRSLYDILIGIKYGYYFLRIRISAVRVGFVLPAKQYHIFQKHLLYLLCGIVCIGIFRQLAKYAFPNVFLQIGYGPIGDFVFGQQPPLYYRTGPGGYPRLQGIFSGPNNYGYFLAAFLPTVILLLRTYTQRKIFIIGLSVFLISILLTLSRTAIIGSIVGILLLAWKYMKQKIAILVISILCVSIAVGVLSIIKPGSTQTHMKQKYTSIQYILQKPIFGYGLGSSGPAIHHNGTILPENYYMQISIDSGIIGLCALLVCIIAILFTIYRSTQSHIDMSYVYGFIAILSMGMLLHVFEDSMVNYLFFIPFGIHTGHMLQTKYT